jgi:hypothetical protein
MASSSYATLADVEYLAKWLEPSVLASVIVAAVAIWYSVETQRLRRTAVKQFDLTRQAMFSGLLPFVLAGIRKPSSLPDERRKEVDDQISHWTVRRIQLPGVTRGIDMTKTTDEVFEVTSTTDQVASHVLCLMFRADTRRFAVSQYQIEVIAPRETGYFAILEETLASDDVIELIKKLYEARGEYLEKAVLGISRGAEDVLLPIFFDLAGRLYATPRSLYRHKDGSITYGKSDLLQPDGYPESFAPPFESTTKLVKG